MIFLRYQYTVKSNNNNFTVLHKFIVKKQRISQLTTNFPFREKLVLGNITQHTIFSNFFLRYLYLFFFFKIYNNYLPVMYWWSNNQFINHTFSFFFYYNFKKNNFNDCGGIH